MKTSVAPKTYFLVAVALLFLLALTAAAAFLNLGPFNTPVAIGIAVCKASLILLVFMHVGYGRRLIWIFAGLGFAWLAILFTLSLSDFLSRNYLHIPGK